MYYCRECGRWILYTAERRFVCPNCEKKHYENYSTDCRYLRDGECTLHLSECNRDICKEDK